MDPAKPRSNRILGLFTTRELALMAIPLLCVASLHISMKPLLGLLYVVGRDGGCTLDRALAAQEQLALQNRLSEELFAQSKMEEQVTVRDWKLQRWSTPWGTFWAPAETSVSFLLAEQKMRIYGDGPRRVQPGDIVLDAGANIGTFTREALMAGAAKVIAIEPSERNVECLNRNFAKEIAEGRVIVYPKGVWHKDDILEFTVFDNSALDSLVMKERPETTSKPRIVKVPVTTVDNLVAELGLPRVNFIKMDVEGAERDALRGAAATIRNMRPRMSLATENLDDDYKVVPNVLRQIRADYQSDCGPCQLQAGYRLRQDVRYFY
ncbi:MAG: FkbM family methyltransferase [Bryobacterales bacterium]|nr:FkbM family methyltransferase [Bryobacterales bacterium]